MDTKKYLKAEFLSALKKRGSTLDADTLAAIEASFDLTAIQELVQARLFQLNDKEKKKLEKSTKKRLGKLARGFANIVADSIESSDTVSNGVRSAFNLWKKSSGYLKHAKQFHSTASETNNTASCSEAFSKI